MMHIRQSEEGKRHRRQSSISSNGDDWFLDSSGLQGQPSSLQGQWPPQVVTLSEIGDLKSSLGAKDARISFLEQELVDTRLQLALAKTSEDRLVMELHNMNLELTEAKRTSSICFVSEDDDSDRSARLSSLSEQQPAVASPDEVNKPGDAVQAPVLTRQIRHDISTSRKRGAEEEPSTNSSYWQNLNPASCASGLRLLEGDFAPGGSISTRRMSNGVNNNIMWAPAMNSTTSINRHLGNMGLSIYSSEDFLKKRRIGKNKLAKNKVQKNEEWGIAPPRYQPLPMGRNNPPTTTSSYKCDVVNHRNKQSFFKLEQELDVPAAPSGSKIMSYWKPVKHNRTPAAA